MATYLITGSSRGLGMALATELSASPESEVSLIFATSRTKDPAALTSLSSSTSGRVVPVQLDPNDPESVKDAVEFVQRTLQERGKKGLDVLVNNSGVSVYTGGGIENMPPSELTSVFHTNVTLTHIVTLAFLPLLRAGKRKVIANISSTVGSIGLSPKFHMNPAYSYKVSKAGMNMLTSQYAIEFSREGFTSFAISPGWLRTDLGGEYADLPVEVGAREVARYVKGADSGFNGRFLNIRVPGWEDKEGANRYDGEDPPW
ncbi:hypothetical protein BDV19DRAFT_355417 [Aspergillus venezuelensis]